MDFVLKDHHLMKSAICNRCLRYVFFVQVFGSWNKLCGLCSPFFLKLGHNCK